MWMIHLFHVCCSAIGDEDFCEAIFEEYVNHLKEVAKENERRRKEEKVLVSFCLLTFLFTSYKRCFFGNINESLLITGKEEGERRKREEEVKARKGKREGA